MADVRIRLLDYLRAAADPELRRALVEALGAIDVAAARTLARDDPASGIAVATMLGAMHIAEATTAEMMDAAKLAATRAPRDDAGNEVALLAGVILWRLGGDLQAAEPYFRRMRRADPGHPDVLAFYRELFVGESGAAQLVQVLIQARRAVKDAEERFKLAQEVAELAEHRQGSVDRAIETWRSVLREDGYDPRAQAALERLYRAGGKWTALVDLLKDEAERLAASPGAAEQRIARLLEIAQLYRDRLKLDTMALATLQRILDVDPHHEASLEALAETYAKAGRHNDLLGVYQRRIDAAREAGDRARQADLLRKVARIWVDDLGNPQRALEPLQTVLDLDPRDGEARSQLARIHELRRDFRALIALRRQELDGLDSADALELRLELAHLAEERLGDRREAVAAYNDVLTHHGDDARALVALARLYERESRWPSAAEVLHRQLAHADSDAAVGILIALGNIYSDRLASRDDAVAVWSELLRVHPGHDRALRRLRDAYVAAGEWDELQAMYAGQGRLADVIDVLQGAADRLPDTESRVALYRRVAALCQGELRQPERALRALERTLAIQPDNLDVARELVPIYREQRNWARLLGTYEVLMRAAANDDERLELIDALRRISEEKLASPALTLQWAAEAYRLRPGDATLRANLESAAERADGWDEISRIFEARISEPAVADDERLALLDKLAIVARDKLSKPDDAQRHYRRIIALDPRNAGAMTALESIYTATRRWEDLAEVYRRRLEVEGDADVRLATVRALARLQEEELGDLDGAVASHTAVLAAAPEDPRPLDALARIHRNRGNWAELGDVLRAKLERETSHSRRASLIFELADVHATRLADTAAATTGFLAVLELEPEHEPSVIALEGLREADPSQCLVIMRGLLPYYRRVDDRRREAEALEVIVAAETDQAARLALSEQLAAIYEKMPDRRDDALRIRGELLRAQPHVYQGRQIFCRLGAEIGRVVDVAHAYQEVLGDLAREAEAADAEGRTLERERVALRRDLLLELAAIRRDRLGSPGGAEQAYAEVLEQDETHQGAYEALEALLRARGAHAELRALYRRRVDVTFNAREQKELLSRIVDLSRAVLDDRATAVATAEELLDLIPDDMPTIELLASMYEISSDHGERIKLEELLGRMAELERDRKAARSLQVRRAILRMQDLGDAVGAVDLLGQVLGEDPDDTRARGLLEELMGVSEVSLQACALLEPIYARRGDHEGRIRVLMVRREHAEAEGARDQAITYLSEIARIREHELGDRHTAFAVAREAFLADPRRSDTRAEVERLGDSLGRHAELVELWRLARDSEAGQDPALRIDLTRRIAELLDDRLRDGNGARAAWAELVAIDLPDVALAQRAATALCRLHLEAGDGPALVDAKRALLRFAGDTDTHVRIRLEIAEIQEQLGDRVGAAVTHSEVLDLMPGSLAALDALERLFLEEQEWQRLCEVLEHRIGVTPDPKQKGAIWRHIGEVQRDQLHDLQRALAAFQSVLELKVGREDTIAALSALVALYEKLERWPDIDEALRRLTALADSDNIRVELLSRTAIVVGRRLGRGADALELLKRALDLAPTHANARAEVARYLEGDDTRERAIRILMPLFEAEQNWPELLALEELQARKQPSGRRRLAALLRVAKTQEERIGDPQRAFSVLCEAMTEAADQPELAEVLGKVERLGAEADRAEGLLAAYASTADHILDADLQQRVLRAMGQVALDRLGRLDDARHAYERVMALHPGDPQAADALERIYLQQAEFEPLANLLAGRADRTADVTVRDGFLARAADIMRRQLERPEDAIRLYERLSAEGLSRPDVKDALEHLYEVTGRWRELTAHLGRKLTAQTGHAAVDAHLRLGRLYGEKLDDPETGIRHLATALKLDPDHAVATAELGRYLEDPSMRVRVAELLEPVFAAVGDWHRLIQIHEIRLAEAADDGARSKNLLRIAQIEEEQLEELDRAFDSYTRLFREQPGDRYVRDQLARLAGVLGHSERYAELLTSFAGDEGAADQGDDILSIVREAAELWIGPLRQPARAVPLFERLLASRPGDIPLFSQLERALMEAESWRALADAYWRAVDGSVAVDRQIELLRRLAGLAQEQLNDKHEAARAYQRMLELRPDYELARTRLEQNLGELGRHADLLDALRDRLVRTSNADERSRVAMRIAQLQEGPLEDAEGAVDTLESILNETTDDREAVAMLERIAQTRSAMRPRLLAILRPIYERARNTQRLVEVDEWQLAHTSDPATRHELFFEMATLQLRGHDSTEAGFAALLRALAEPGPPEALARLDAEAARIASLLQTEARLVEALVAAADGPALTGDTERRVELLVWAAKLRHGAGDVAGAADVLRLALASDPDHGPALELLDAALGRQGDAAALVEVLAKRADLATDDRDRVELIRRRATLLDDALAQPDNAEVAWRALLDIEATDRDALARLAVSYERRGAVAELIDVTERQIEGALPGEARRALQLRLAGFHRARGNRSGEIDTLQTLLGERTDDAEAMATLTAALLAEGRNEEAVDVLQRRAEFARTETERAALLHETGRLQAGPIGDVGGAIESYKRALELVPSFNPALADLVALAKLEGSHDTAAAAVMGRLQEAGRFAELAEVLQARIRLVEDPDERAAALQSLARLRIERLEDPAGALICYDELLGLVEGGALRDALERGGRLAVELGRGAEHADKLRALAMEVERDPNARVMIASYAAQLAEEILGDSVLALAILGPLVNDGLATPEVCAKVERLGRATKTLGIVESALREAARLSEDDGARAEALVRLGAVQLELERTSLALDAFRDAFELGRAPAALAGMEQLFARGGDAPAVAVLDALENAYQLVGDRTNLARIVRARLRGAGESERTRLLEQLATLLEEGGAARTDVLAVWGELLILDPDASAPADRLLAIGRAGLLREACDALIAGVMAGRARDHLPIALALSTAMVLHRELGDHTRALELAELILGADPDHAETIDLGIAAARAAGRHRTLHELLRRAAQQQPDLTKAARLWAEAAQVAERDLGDGAAAIEDLEREIAADDGDVRPWQHLLTLLGAAADHRRLADVLGRRILATSDEGERRNLRLRLARVLRDNLERPEDAVSSLGDLLADRPDDTEARDELDQLLRQLERWEDVRENLEQKLATAEGGDRVETLEELARLAEDRLGDRIDAIGRYRAIRDEHPEHAAADAALERLYSAEESYTDLAELLEARMGNARASGDLERYRATASRLAELLAERLGDAERAQRILDELLEVDRGYVPAILALAAVFEARGDEGAMRITLQRAVDLDPRGAIGAQLQLRLARLAGSDTELKHRHLRTAFGLDPSNAAVTGELLTLCRRLGHWAEVAQILEQMEESERDPTKQRALGLERVDLLLGKVGDAEAALAALAPIYQKVQDDAEINRRIADALFGAGRLDEAEGMYRWLVEMGRRGKRVKALAHHLTRLAQIDLRRESRGAAREHLQEAYRIDTTNVETLMTLGALHESEREWKDALKIYRTMLLQNADQSGLLRRGDIYIGIARAHMQLEEKPKAKAMLRRGIEEDAGHPELPRELAALED